MVVEVQLLLLAVVAPALPGIVFHSLRAVLALTCHLMMMSAKSVVAVVWFLILVAVQLLSTVRSLL
jgi:hypothetical protein